MRPVAVELTFVKRDKCPPSDQDCSARDWHSVDGGEGDDHHHGYKDAQPKQQQPATSLKLTETWGCFQKMQMLKKYFCPRERRRGRGRASHEFTWTETWVKLSFTERWVTIQVTVNLSDWRECEGQVAQAVN